MITRLAGHAVFALTALSYNGAIAAPDPSENKPMQAMPPDQCNRLKDQNSWSTAKAWANTIGTGPVSMASIVQTDLNRVAPAIVSTTRTPQVPPGTWKYGFEWDSGDQAVQYWVPQGMTHGSVVTTTTTSIALVSWFYKTQAQLPQQDPNPPSPPYNNGDSDGGGKGARISIVNLSQTISNMNAGYRHVLLVEPTGTGKYKPVANHAGGLVWYGNYLYLADTAYGIRVFDLANIRQVQTDNVCSTEIGKIGTAWCAYGYKYVIPQISFYIQSTDDGIPLKYTISNKCTSKFSWLGKDATKNPPEIVSGEWCDDGKSDSWCSNDPANAHGMGGRLFRWSVDPATSKIAANTSSGTTKPNGVLLMNKRNVQGAAPVIGAPSEYYLSSSRRDGELYRVSLTTPWVAYRQNDNEWVWYPEGMHASMTGSHNLWTATEGRNFADLSKYINPRDGGRAVFAIDTDYLK